MSTLDPTRISILTEECRPLIEGARVENVHQSEADTVTLSLYGAEAGKAFLLFCVHPRLGRFHLLTRRPASLSNPPAFCRALRSHLRGLHVMSIAASEWTVNLKLGTLDQTMAARLTFTASERRPVLELYDASGESLHALDSKSSGQDLDSELKWSAAPSASVEGELPAAHADLARRFATEDDAVRSDERIRLLRTRVSRVLAKRTRLIENLDRDLAKAERAESDRRAGELLNAARGQIRRGMHEIVVCDYFDPALAEVRVALDPALSPQENIDRYFKRYRKSQRGLPIIQERRERFEGERRQLEELLHCLDDSDAGEHLAELEPRVEELCRRHQRRQRKGPKTTAAAGPRRFLSQDSLEVLIGRTSKGNDELTLKIARGNDVFLHVSGRAGAHVIVRLGKDNPLPQETLLDAAHLAYYYSLPDAARKRIQDGAAVDVDYTPAKYVRKQKGAPPGLVLMSKHKTLRLRVELTRLERLTRG